MKQNIIIGLGVGLLLAAQLAEANGAYGLNTAPLRSNFSFNNGVKMYAGVSAGYGVQGDACTMPFFEGECEDGDFSWKVTGGVRINPMFGAELAYANLGKTEKKGTIAGQAARTSNQVAGYQLNGVGYLPLHQYVPNLEMTAKGGVMFWERDSSEALGDAEPKESRANGTTPMAGVGLQYQLDQNLHLRGEWDHVFNTGIGSNYESDADNYSVGLMYSTL